MYQPPLSYWPSNHLKIAPTATLLQAFSSALHARSMALMADFVVNHVAFPLATANSTFDPTIGESSPGAGNGLYGVFDASADYHPACAIQDGNQTSAELCWLSYPVSVPYGCRPCRFQLIVCLLFFSIRVLSS